MTPDFVNTLQTLSFDSCRSSAIAEVSKLKSDSMKQKARRNRLIRDIQVAPNKNEIIRICYQLVLASEGLRTHGSKFDKFYKNI